MNETPAEGTLAQSHDGTRWWVSEDGMFAKRVEDASADWRHINEVRMEVGVLWPVTKEDDDG